MTGLSPRAFRGALIALTAFVLAAFPRPRPAAAGAAGDAEPAEGPRILVVQPGYPGSTDDAAGYMRRFAEWLAGEAEIEGLGAIYHNLPDRALAALRRGRDAGRVRAALVSPGFYLAHRRELGLLPLLEVLPEGRLRIYAPEDGAGSVAELSGRPVAGGPLHEPAFLERTAFAGTEGAGEWKPVPTLRVTRALRRLQRGTYAALVLTEREHRTLEKIERLEGLREIARSPELPTALVVAVGAGGVAEEDGDPERRDLPAEVRRLREALRRMPDDDGGREILETLGCVGFRPVRVGWLEKLERQYDAHEETK